MATIPQRIIADLNWYGHIPMYHRMFVKAFAEIGYRVISLSPAPEEMQQWIEESNLAPTCQANPTPIGSSQPPGRRLRSFLDQVPGGAAMWNYVRSSQILRRERARRRWSLLSNLLARLKTTSSSESVVFFPYLDDLSHPNPQSLGLPWAGLYLNSDLMRKSPGFTRRAEISFFRKAAPKYIATLDELLADQLPEWPVDIPLISFPDVTDTAPPYLTPTVEAALQRARGRPIVALLGHLTPRKGVSRLIELSQHPAAQNLFFLFAGEAEAMRLSRPNLEFLHQASVGAIPNAHALLGRIQEESVFNGLVSGADVIYACYEDFSGSSNLLTKAAYFQRPSLVRAFGCMAARIRRLNSGLVFAAGTPKEELDMLLTLASEKKESRASAYAAYQSEHSYARLLSIIQRAEGLN